MGSPPTDPKPKRPRSGTLRGVGSDLAKFKAAAQRDAALREPGTRKVPRPGRAPRDGKVDGQSTNPGDGVLQLPPFDESSESPALSAGQIVGGKFALIRMVAEGGLAQVFEAEDTLVGRRVALKVLTGDLASSPEVVRRFRREAHATALVAHPHVVTVFEVGRRTDGALYIAEELLLGPTLEEHKKARGRLPEEEVVRIVAPIAGALATAHALGVVHRDVKPSNIVLATTHYAEHVPKLIDFGVARVQNGRGRGRTLVGTLLGTAHYMSPEQALGEGWVDGRTDVWALGVVAYELLTGVCPFEGPNEHAVLAKLLAEPAPRIETRVPGIGPALAALVHAALERDASKRPTMRAMAAELGRLSGSRELVAAFAGEAPDPRVSQGGAVDSEELRFDPETTTGDGARAGSGRESIDDSAEPLEDGDIEVVEPARGDDAVTTVRGERGRGPAEVDNDYTREVAGRDAADRFADAAQRALRVNALESAIMHAEGGVEHATGELLGQLRLVQAIASYWLGHYELAEQHAAAAMAALPEATTGWYAALGHLVMARARVGRHDGAEELQEALTDPSEARIGAAHVIAVSRLALMLTGAGKLVGARQLIRSVRDRMDRHASTEPVVFAWLDLAFAERAMFVGDPTRELSRRASALERFTAAGDVRNACQERASFGTALLRVGAFDDGERLLYEALGIAEPMKLSVAYAIRASLALGAFRLRQPERAIALATEALTWARAQGDRKLEALTRIYLSRTHGMIGDESHAMAQAESAAAAALPFPALRAYAHGVRADALLNAGRARLAMEPALAAVRLLDEHGGAGEAESLIRLTHALALAAGGEQAEARLRIQEARARVLGLTERLGDPRHKRWFLERLPENARILEVAREWAGDPAVDPRRG
jgi:serine/threonine protein kinase/tetratricopeptide (TPR) repeat protein